MTPATFTFSGRWVDWPPYIFRPTTRLAYCTGIFRCPRSKKTIDRDDRDDDRQDDEAASNAVERRPGRATSDQVCTTASGMPATMPAKMISEMPLPMPRSVICSPSHMMKAVPVVSEIMVEQLKPRPG